MRPTVLLLALSALVTAHDLAQSPSTRPLFKGPLDLAIAEAGHSARVQLTGSRTTALIDLTSGVVTEEKPWTAEQNLTSVEQRSLHVPDGLRQQAAELQLAGAGNIRAVAADGDESFFLIAHQLPKAHIPATHVPQGWVFTNALTRYRLKRVGEGAWLLPGRQTVVLDGPHRAFADPSDVVVSPDGRRAFVACAGADTVLVIDLRRMQALVDRLGEKVAHSYPSHFQVEDMTAGREFILAELPTQANPRRLALSSDGRTLVVSNHLADSLTVIDTAKLKVLRHIPLGDMASVDAVRRGEILFNSSRLTQLGQFSCASCHPNGGADGLNWDLSRDGVGNFKNTKSLRGVKDTAPYGWLGSSPTLADRIQGTLRTLHRLEPNEQELNDLTAYLESLSPTRDDSSPQRQQGTSTEGVSRGKALFEGKARCGTCHSGSAFDDSLRHDVGTGLSNSDESRFNTPSLLGLTRTAPYLHDGRADTLEDLFRKDNPRQKHGHAHELTDSELADLIQFLKTL